MVDRVRVLMFKAKGCSSAGPAVELLTPVELLKQPGQTPWALSLGWVDKTERWSSICFYFYLQHSLNFCCGKRCNSSRSFVDENFSKCVLGFSNCCQSKLNMKWRTYWYISGRRGSRCWGSSGTRNCKVVQTREMVFCFVLFCCCCCCFFLFLPPSSILVCGLPSSNVCKSAVCFSLNLIEDTWLPYSSH